MNLDELYAEKQKLCDTYLNTKTFIAGISVMVFSVLLAIYAMKDSFSYILTGLILLTIYSVAHKFIYKNLIVNEIKSLLITEKSSPNMKK